MNHNQDHTLNSEAQETSTEQETGAPIASPDAAKDARLPVENNRSDDIAFEDAPACVDEIAENRAPCPSMADCASCPSACHEDTESPSTEPESIEVVGIRFRQSGKVYYFAPGSLQLKKGDGAVVETARGVEYGTVSIANRIVSSKEIVAPLRPVLRCATEEDREHHRFNLEKETEAYNICLEKIEEMRLEMKLVDVEYTFDNSKLLFYYTADGRVDFRDLVRNLASIFRTRIEMRQIGIRDEAKMRGGLGICGRPFCCGTFLNDFAQVSIKMAKEQNLSLNSSKISGTCGRLMCCLRYEYDTYVEEIAKTPKLDAVVTTPDGDGYVTEISPLAGLCRVKLLAAPDAVPKYYHRDLLTFKGIFRKDLGPINPRPTKEEKSEQIEGRKRPARRSQRRTERPTADSAPSETAPVADDGKKSNQ